jgi:putative membrane protein
MLKLDLSKPQRQSPVGVAVIFFQKLRLAINLFISIAVVQFGFKANLSSFWFMVLIALVLIIVLVIAFLIYRKFFFYVEEDKFVIEKGLLSKEKITIPFERIQSVHIHQNLIQRMLSVVGLKIDTAGSAMKELEISALPNLYARSLQEFLIEKKKEEAQDEETHEQTDGLEERAQTELFSEKKPLVRLSLLDVIKIGLTENHLRSGFVLFAILNGYLWQYEEYLLEPFKPFLERNADLFLAQWIILLPIALILFLLISTIISLVQSLLRHFGLKFFLDQKGVQLVAGLLKRAEYQIPVNKIQFLKWSSNPLRRMIGLKTLVVKQAGSNEAGDRQSLMVPGCKEEQLQAVLDEFFPERAASRMNRFGTHPFFKTQISLLVGVLPALLGLVLFFVNPYYLLIPALWLIVTIPLARKYASSVQLFCNEEVIEIRKGWIFPKSEIIKYYKIQNLRFNQNLLQKRRGTVHMDFYTAAGSLRMWHLNEKVAQELYNYILFKVEKSKQYWM